MTTPCSVYLFVVSSEAGYFSVTALIHCRDGNMDTSLALLSVRENVKNSANKNLSNYELQQL